MTDIQTEKSFEVASTPEEAWSALEALRVRAGGVSEWWLPGFDCRAEEVSSAPPAQLTVRKLEEPCAGSLIAVTFEHVATGCRMRVVQSGFDAAFVERAGEGFWIHGEHILADFHLFFATGVLAGRAWRPWAPLGVGVASESFGLRVTGVRSGTWADRVGLQPDDVLLTVAGAPIYSVHDLGVVERMVCAGGDVAATWGRAGAHASASATV